MGQKVLVVGGSKAALPISKVRAGGSGLSVVATDTGTLTIQAGSAGTKKVILVCTVTGAFANGSGAQPTFEIGETGDTDKFAATSKFTGATLGTVFTITGELAANKALIVTATARTGTGTGAMDIVAIVAPSI